MTAFLIVGMIFALLTLRQPLLVILLAIAAIVHLKWGQGKLDFIIEDMWVGLDKEVILSIPLFILCGNVMTRGSIAQRLIRILGVDHQARCPAAWRWPASCRARCSRRSPARRSSPCWRSAR